MLRETLQELTNFGDGGRQPGQFYGVHSIATDSKGNIYTTQMPIVMPSTRTELVVS